MENDNRPLLKLTVNTSDDAAEIIIVDGQYHEIADAVGKKALFELPEGVYTVRLKAGTAMEEQLVILRKDQEINFDRIFFASAAPLQGTSLTHEFHMANADNYSKNTSLAIGDGSEMYLFIRNWTGKTRPDKNPDFVNPANGITLRDRNDNILVDFEQASAISPDPFDTWAACNVRLAPGTYCLCQKVANDDTMRQTIVCCGGWQTQVFFFQQNADIQLRDPQKGLSNSAIFMTRIGMGFQSQGKQNDYDGTADLRLTEFARQGLLNERNVISREVLNQMMNEKFDNPMLGIYAAHLLLLPKNRDESLAREIVMNLRKILNTPHPDVEALALRLMMDSNYVFDMPPMLRRSWNFMLEASVKDSTKVPEDSLAADVAARLWCEDLWLLWGEPYETSLALETLVKQLTFFGQNQNYNIDAEMRRHQMSMNRNWDPDRRFYKYIAEENSAELNESASNYNPNPLKIKDIVQSLGVPRSKVETMLRNNNIHFE